MNKTELIDKIAAGAEITKAQAKAAYEAFHFAAAFYMLALLDNPCLLGFVES